MPRPCAGSFNRFYYGTDARMSELLIGVIAALALYYWHISLPRPAGRAAVRGHAARRLPGSAVVFFGAMTYRNGGASYQHGGAFIIALATAVLIIGGLEGRNGVARLCSARWLVCVGKVSYGAYLYHWPIFALSGKHWGPLHGQPRAWRSSREPGARRGFVPLPRVADPAPAFRPIRRRTMLRGWSGTGERRILAVALPVHPFALAVLLPAASRPRSRRSPAPAPASGLKSRRP